MKKIKGSTERETVNEIFGLVVFLRRNYEIF